MTYRLRHLVNDAVQSSNDSTYELSLPESGNLHSLIVRVRCTNGATASRNVGPLTIADNIRVVGNGEEKFFELSPVELEKWIETTQGIGLDMEHDEAASAVQYVCFPILFGRKLYDREMYLPLSRIKNPKLQIPFSPAISATVGFATGTVTFDVLGIWSPENLRLPYLGTLITKTIKVFTSVASGDEPTDVDVFDSVRAIGVYAYENNVADGVDINRVRLVANGGEFDIFQGDWDNFTEFNRQNFGCDITHRFKLLAQDTDVLATRLSDPREYSVSNGTITDIAGDIFVIAGLITPTGDNLTLSIGDGDITAGAETYVTSVTNRIYYVSVTGRSPSYFGLIPYMWPDEPQGYLKVNDYNKLELILTQGGADAAVRISVQTLKQVALI